MSPWKVILLVALIAVGLGLFSSYYMYGHQVERCDLCGIGINPTFEARLHLRDGTIKRYCCIHCALQAYRELKGRVEWVSVTDQETGQKINADDAVYVKNDIPTCRPCGLRVHIFEAETQAGLFYEHRVDKYMRVFGGRIVDNPFREAGAAAARAGQESR